MDESKNNESVGKVNDEPSAQPIDMVAKAEAAAKKLEEANKRMEENIQRQEALAVERTLGGQSEVNVEKPKEETPEEYAAKIMKGE